MINKDKLKGKYITFIDKQGKYRTHRVTKVNGLTLTTVNCLGEKRRIHPKKNLIIGRQMRHEIIPIDWGLSLKGAIRQFKTQTHKVVYND